MISPVFAPRIWTRTFVPTVVPCSSSSISPKMPSGSTPRWRAASSIASRKPCEKSWGVDEAFASVIVPVSSTSTQSVNVPPMSTPQ